MTMPHLMNCSHSGDSWCLDCVGKLGREHLDLQEKYDNLLNVVHIRGEQIAKLVKCVADLTDVLKKSVLEK